MRWFFTLQFYLLPYDNCCWHIFFHTLFRHPVLGSQQLVALFGFITNLPSQPQTLRLLHVTDYWHPRPWTAGEPERLSKSQAWGHLDAQAVISGKMCLYCRVTGMSELGPGPAAIWPGGHGSQLLISLSTAERFFDLTGLCCWSSLSMWYCICCVGTFLNLKVTLLISSWPELPIVEITLEKKSYF